MFQTSLPSRMGAADARGRVNPFTPGFRRLLFRGWSGTKQIPGMKRNPERTAND